MKYRRCEYNKEGEIVCIEKDASLSFEQDEKNVLDIRELKEDITTIDKGIRPKKEVNVV